MQSLAVHSVQDGLEPEMEVAWTESEFLVPAAAMAETGLAFPAAQRSTASPRTFRRSDSTPDCHFRNVRSATFLLESAF